MYHYVYRIEHIETKQFYIGSRSSEVHPTLDSYLGSMKTWKPDKTKLKKEIIKDDFICREDALKFETEEITNCIEDPLNENYYIPFNGFHTIGSVMVKNSEGHTFLIKIDDPRYASGELKPIALNRVAVIDSNGNVFCVNTDDPRYLSGELKSLQSTKKGSHYVCDKLKRRVNMVSRDGIVIRVGIDDCPSLIDNGYVYVWSNRCHSDETKQKMRESHAGKQAGNKNSQHGTMWIHNIELKQNKKIKITDVIPNGWSKGRVIKDS
ncbi:MAG: hypothetical protein WC979_03395 [Candidatus Pacearchaeota archaeon]|jgi:hypothetical protein|nr:hypothetical protein [Clostridia bacterium]